MMRGADYSLARMSGMLDLSKDEKAKHFLPRWFLLTGANTFCFETREVFDTLRVRKAFLQFPVAG